MQTSLPEMIAAIEAVLAKCSDGPFAATDSCVAHWVETETFGRISMALCHLIDGNYPQRLTDRSRADAHLIAALLNGLPERLAGAKRMLDSVDRLELSASPQDWDIAAEARNIMTALIEPEYRALVASGAIQEDEHA